MIIYRGTKSPCFFDIYQKFIHNKKSLEFWQKKISEYTIYKGIYFFHHSHEKGKLFYTLTEMYA